MKKLIFLDERIAKQVYVKGVKLPEDAIFHLFSPPDQSLNTHPIPVQLKLQNVVNRSRKQVSLTDEYFSLYYKNSAFEFKCRKLFSGRCFKCLKKTF